MIATLNFNTSIGDVARDHPEYLGVFDRLQLDYCCRGHESLEQACKRAGIDTNTLLQEIASLSLDAGTAEAPRSMTEWCDHIESVHHRLAREVFLRLGVMMPRVLAAHRTAHPEYELLDRVLAGLREEMLDHMVREERVLFPWLRRLEQPGAIHVGPPWSVQRPIDCMIHDHDSVSDGLERIRTLTSHYTVPSDACGTVRAVFALLQEFEADTRRHIHKENNILFPAGLEAEARSGRTIVREPAAACSHAESPTEA